MATQQDDASKKLRRDQAAAVYATPHQWTFRHSSIASHMKKYKIWLDGSPYCNQYDKRFPWANPSHILLYWEHEVAKAKIRKSTGLKLRLLYSSLKTYLSQLVWIYTATIQTVEGARAFAEENNYPLPHKGRVDFESRDSVVDRVKRLVNLERLSISVVGPVRADIDMLYPMIQTLAKEKKISFVRTLTMVISSIHWCVRQQTLCGGRLCCLQLKQLRPEAAMPSAVVGVHDTTLQVLTLQTGGISTNAEEDLYSGMIPHRVLQLDGPYWMCLYLIERWAVQEPDLTPEGFRQEYLYAAAEKTPRVRVTKGTYSKNIKKLKEFLNIFASKVTHIGREYCGMMLGLADVEIAKINKAKKGVKMVANHYSSDLSPEAIIVSAGFDKDTTIAQVSQSHPRDRRAFRPPDNVIEQAKDALMPFVRSFNAMYPQNDRTQAWEKKFDEILRSFQTFEWLLIHFVVCSALDGESLFGHHDVYRNGFFQSAAYTAYKNEPRMVDQRAVLAKGHKVQVPHALALSNVGQQNAIHHKESLVQYEQLRSELGQVKEMVKDKFEQMEEQLRLLTQQLAGGGVPRTAGSMPASAAGSGSGCGSSGGSGSGSSGGSGSGSSSGSLSAVVGVAVGRSEQRAQTNSLSGVTGIEGGDAIKRFVELPQLSTIKFDPYSGPEHGCQYVAQLFLGVVKATGAVKGLGMQPKPLLDQDRKWKTVGRDVASRLEKVWKMIVKKRGDKIIERNSKEERTATMAAARAIDVMVFSDDHFRHTGKTIKHMGEFVKDVLNDAGYDGPLKVYLPVVKRRIKRRKIAVE